MPNHAELTTSALLGLALLAAGCGGGSGGSGSGVGGGGPTFDVSVSVAEAPARAAGGPAEPPQAGFEFTAASDSAGVPRLDFQVTPGSQGAASGAVLAAPASGQLTVGEPVAVELRVEDCLKGTAEPVTTAIGITVEHADRIETAWTWECDEGNPRIVQVETYQGPLVSRLLVESGDTDGRGGVAVHPQAGRFAVVSVHVEHDSEGANEVAVPLPDEGIHRTRPRGALASTRSGDFCFGTFGEY